MNNQKLVLLQLSAEWCNPCKVLKEKMESGIDSFDRKDEIEWVSFIYGCADVLLIVGIC